MKEQFYDLWQRLADDYRLFVMRMKTAYTKLRNVTKEPERVHNAP